MAGITELYTAKAMLDSQMIYGGKQGEKLFIVLKNKGSTNASASQLCIRLGALRKVLAAVRWALCYAIIL